VFSVGDVLIVVAVALLVYKTCQDAPDMETEVTGSAVPSSVERSLLDH
jgi:hypothetical protein